MKSKRQKVILTVLLVASLVACGAPKGLIEPGKTTTPNTAQPTQSAAPTIKPTRAPIELRQGDGVAAFSLTAADFIVRFNEQWRAVRENFPKRRRGNSVRTTRRGFPMT